MDVKEKNFILFRHLASDKSEKFLHNIIFFALEAIPFLIAWLTSTLLIATISSFIFCLIFYLFSDDGTLFAPLAFFYMISFRTFPNNDQIPLDVYIALGIFFLFIILYIIKRKYLHIPFAFTGGGMGISLIFIALILSLSYVIQATTAPSEFQTYGLLYYLYLIAYVLIFLLLTTLGIKGYSASLKDIFIVLNIVILFQLFYVSILNHDLFYNIGWGNEKNTIVITLESSLPFLLISKKEKFFTIKNILILLLLLTNLVVILSSDCRGGMITTVLVIPLICYLVVPNYSFKKRILITLITILVAIIFGVLIYLLIPSVKDSINRLIDMGDNISGRDKIWEQVMIIFNDNPIFGGGPTSLFEINSALSRNTFNMMLCHNTFYTMLAMGGILGVIGYIIWLFETIYTSLSLNHNLRVAIILFILFGFIHGLIDNTFMSPTYMFPALLIFTNGDILGTYKVTKGLKNKTIKLFNKEEA